MTYTTMRRALAAVCALAALGGGAAWPPRPPGRKKSR